MAIHEERELVIEQKGDLTVATFGDVELGSISSIRRANETNQARLQRFADFMLQMTRKAADILKSH